jgi:hypothetical protein
VRFLAVRVGERLGHDLGMTSALVTISGRRPAGAVRRYAGLESVVTALVVVVAAGAGVAGLESVGGLESAVTALVVTVAGLESVGALESVVTLALALGAAFTATFTVLQTLLPLVVVHTRFVVNLAFVAAVAVPPLKGAVRARTVTAPTANRMMGLRGFVIFQP